jgi:hypothetical protein
VIIYTGDVCSWPKADIDWILSEPARAIGQPILRIEIRSASGNRVGSAYSTTRMPFHRSIQACGLALVLGAAASASAQELKRDPTPQDYVERNGGGATIVQASQLVLDGHRMRCGQWATVLDPNLNDYAAAPYRQFVILNMLYVAKVPTAVKLWIYNHECGHLLGGPDENKADCFAVRRGRAAGWLMPQGLDEVCSFISAARPDTMHVSGPDRCKLMRQCWRDSEPKPAQ